MKELIKLLKQKHLLYPLVIIQFMFFFYSHICYEKRVASNNLMVYLAGERALSKIDMERQEQITDAAIRDMEVVTQGIIDTHISITDTINHNNRVLTVRDLLQKTYDLTEKHQMTINKYQMYSYSLENAEDSYVLYTKKHNDFFNFGLFFLFFSVIVVLVKMWD